MPLEPVHSTAFGGGHTIAGGLVSCTVTRPRHDAAFPLWSMAVNVTGVVPRLKNAGALLPSAGCSSQASVADAPAKKDESCGPAAATPVWAEHSARVSAGHVTRGGSESAKDRR